VALTPPPILGLSATGGINFEPQAPPDAGVEEHAGFTESFIAQANARPELTSVYTTFNPHVPQRFLEIDRLKAKTLGVSISDIFDTLQINLGSYYVNDFNMFGRVYWVYLQAEEDARAIEADIGRLQVRNQDGRMIYLDALVSVQPMLGPYSIQHYDMYRSASINGNTAPGYSSGEAVQALQELGDALSEGFGYQWTDVVFQEKAAGSLAPLVFALSLVVVFLVLAALYESWSMPVIILLAIPLGLLGAVAALMLRSMALDVYGQIGLIMLIALVAKNSILIVEFAQARRREGASVLEAAMTAARLRLRPILMTAFAFIIGLMPLVFDSGAGASARRSLGTVVVGGLALATVLIIVVPIYYYVIERLREGGLRWRARPAETGAAPAAAADD
jgi:HAE1 family hydrophobic/amphiphilic exporter-1